MELTGTLAHKDNEPHLTQEQINFFNENGYVLVEDVVPHETCDELRKEIKEIIARDFDPKTHTTVFKTNKDKQNSEDYFYDSAGKISFFLEADAVDKETGKLIRDENIINKIGHALHEKSEPFKAFTFQDRFYNYTKDLEPNTKEPIVVQSMYIFKQPGIGGEVTPHQDSTFLYTHKPCLGFWFALEDATKENGCLWGIPKSQKQGLEKRWKRNSENKMDFVSEGSVSYDAEEASNNDNYVPLEVKKGCGVLLHGHFVHKSGKNTSNKSREIYTFHIIDGQDEYPKENWLQRSDGWPAFWSDRVNT